MPQRPPMTEDWQPGDMAECVKDGWLHGPEKRPRRGSRSMVVRVVEGRSMSGELGHGLELFRYAGRWDATAFRKLPGAEDKAEDEREVLVPERPTTGEPAANA